MPITDGFPTATSSSPPDRHNSPRHDTPTTTTSTNEDFNHQASSSRAAGNCLLPVLSQDQQTNTHRDHLRPIPTPLCRQSLCSRPTSSPHDPSTPPRPLLQPTSKPPHPPRIPHHPDRPRPAASAPDQQVCRRRRTTALSATYPGKYSRFLCHHNFCQRAIRKTQKKVKTKSKL